MSKFTPAMETALAADSPLIVGFLKVELPDTTIRLIDGSGQLTWGTEIYEGSDPVFGTLSAMDGFQDGVGDEAPALSFTLLPASDASAASLSSPDMQGSTVNLWLGAVNRSTGAVIADPLLLFSGELDQPTLSVDKGVRELEFECVSQFERLFDTDEGIKLADSWHEAVWPGEKGLVNITGVTKTAYWGVESPPSAITYYNGSSGYGSNYWSQYNRMAFQ